MSPSRTDIVLTLAGAVAGAVIGFGGSYLSYHGDVSAQRTQAQNRAADIRRTADAELIVQSQTLRGAFTEMNNTFVTDKSGKTWQSRYDKVLEPELIKMARARATVALVSGDGVQKASYYLGGSRDDLIALVAAQMVYKPGSSSWGGVYNAEDFQVRLKQYDDDVRDLIEAARKEAF